MSRKRTMFWICVAVGLFGFILFHQRYVRRLPAGPARVLPRLKASAVTIVLVRPSGPAQLQIRAERTNQAWRLTQPLAFPAQAESVEQLLAYLEKLTPAVYITPDEIRERSDADEIYGFVNPQASLFLQQDDYRPQVLVGATTAPGDQVFLQVVGDQGAYVVDAELLKHIPRSVQDWRETALVDAGLLVLMDRIAVTNNAKALVLQRQPPDGPWRMAWPLVNARTHRTRIEDAIELLRTNRIQRFVTDEPAKAELEAFGFAPPELELALGRGTNTACWLQFGKSPTNDPSLVLARWASQSNIFAVAKDLTAPWLGSIDDFRDPHLLAQTDVISVIEVRGQDAFSVARQTNDAWLVLPYGYAADPELVEYWLTDLRTLRVAQFAKDNVTDLGLPDYGLAAPSLTYILRGAATNHAMQLTNPVLSELAFGATTNQPDRVFARCLDETSVYAIATNDYLLLPSASWQLRNRKVWGFHEDDIAGLTILQNGKVRRLLHRGPHQWSLAPGSQGIINDVAVEETVRGIVQMRVAAWVGRGAENRARFGFTEGGDKLTMELKKGDQVSLEFGAPCSGPSRYAAVTLDGEVWIMEFPWILYRDVVSYLSVP